MEKLTIKEFIETTDINILKEVYAKLVALEMEAIIHHDTAFNPESFKVCYQVATNNVEKTKFTKLQLCGCIVNQAKDLQQAGFTRQHLLRVASLDI